MKNEILEKYKEGLILQGIKPDPYYSTLRAFLNKYGEVNQEAIDDFFKNFNGKTSTRNMYVKALNHYNKIFNTSFVIPKIKKTRQQLPKYIEYEFLRDEILPRLKVIFPKMHLKVKALLLFMFYTGLRKSEIINLKRKDISIIKKRAKIYDQKNDKERIVYFPDKVAEVLVEYFTKEPEKQNAFNVNRAQFDYIFEELKKNFPEKADCLYPHAFRHSFAIHCIKHNVPINVLKEFMGHQSITSTSVYLAVENEMLENYYRKLIK